jgi:hypothetical protein
MDMPKWPKQLTGEFTLTSGWLAANYERAMKEAYAARLVKLRKAAIRFMASDIAKKHEDYGCVDAIAQALADIGELPPDRK